VRHTRRLADEIFCDSRAHRSSDLSVRCRRWGSGRGRGGSRRRLRRFRKWRRERRRWGNGWGGSNGSASAVNGHGGASGTAGANSAGVAATTAAPTAQRAAEGPAQVQARGTLTPRARATAAATGWAMPISFRVRTENRKIRHNDRRPLTLQYQKRLARRGAFFFERYRSRLRGRPRLYACSLP
jgi:hypothetical protein